MSASSPTSTPRAGTSSAGRRLGAEAEAEARKVKDKALSELAEEKRRLIVELREHVAGLSVMAAEKLMRKSVDEGVRKTVLDSFFKDLDRRSGEKDARL